MEGMDLNLKASGEGSGAKRLRSRLADEASRLLESAVYSAQGQFEAAKRWRQAHWCLGGFTAAASAVAAVLTFATSTLQTVAGILAIAAALSAAVHTTINPEKRAERAESAANDYTALRDDLRQFGLLRVLDGDPSALQEDLSKYSNRAANINRKADPIPGFAYKRAKRNIEIEGGQQFVTDS